MNNAKRDYCICGHEIEEHQLGNGGCYHEDEKYIMCTCAIPGGRKIEVVDNMKTEKEHVAPSNSVSYTEVNGVVIVFVNKTTVAKSFKLEMV